METVFKVVRNKTGFARYISRKSHGVGRTALEHLKIFLEKNGKENYTVYIRPRVRYTNKPDWEIFQYNF